MTPRELLIRRTGSQFVSYEQYPRIICGRSRGAVRALKHRKTRGSNAAEGSTVFKKSGVSTPVRNNVPICRKCSTPLFVSLNNASNISRPICQSGPSYTLPLLLVTLVLCEKRASHLDARKQAPTLESKSRSSRK